MGKVGSEEEKILNAKESEGKTCRRYGNKRGEHGGRREGHGVGGGAAEGISVSGETWGLTRGTWGQEGTRGQGVRQEQRRKLSGQSRSRRALVGEAGGTAHPHPRREAAAPREAGGGAQARSSRLPGRGAADKERAAAAAAARARLAALWLRLRRQQPAQPDRPARVLRPHPSVPTPGRGGSPDPALGGLARLGRRLRVGGPRRTSQMP